MGRYTIIDLLEIMKRLRDPKNGCPWDVEQDFESIAPYTIEEAYEVADAIHRDSREDLKDELGDLLFQVVFHSEMARQEGTFDFDDVVATISEKMIRRHPHVFADAEIADAKAQTQAWEAHKAEERKAKVAENGQPASIFDDVPTALPALTRAVKLQNRAARVGFDWDGPEPVIDKLREETKELETALHALPQMPNRARKIQDELGDLFFVIANLCRKLDVIPEQALGSTNAKFVRRIQRIEHWMAARGQSLKDAGLSELDALWDRAKAEEGDAADKCNTDDGQ